jgi:dolichol-phosphate mannosyltransferase
MRRKILVIIPVLNEVKNIKPIVRKLKKIDKFHILFIDDNSKDGTVANIIKEKKKYQNIFLIRRPKKLGIGSAHKDGLKWGYKKKYSIIITMDCDGTHNPIYINAMINLLYSQKIDLVSTNRFLQKNSLDDWSLWRKKLTTLRHYVIKLFLDIKFDSSGAYRCYDVNKIKLQDILDAQNNSYSFFWESIFILSKKYKIKEIPIKLPGRLSGTSKMRLKDIFSAIIYLLKIFIKKRLFI